MDERNKRGELRRGWTTGACATAASKAAYIALICGGFPDPVEITLPGGQKASFVLAKTAYTSNKACVGIVKDAGDDPDVTHGAIICAGLTLLKQGSGIHFLAGDGVGMVTRPGLAIPVGEPAINPVPRKMITQALKEVYPFPDVEVKLSIPNGEKIAQKTLNPRLGIVGGLSILGTTGIVVPFSCAAWIDSIHRGIDVARAMRISHLAASTGHMSEEGIRQIYTFPQEALIDMGDFVGGVLKYIRNHPVRALTIAGGVTKITKLAQGFMDLHSKRGLADLGLLAEWFVQAGGNPEKAREISQANTVAEVFSFAQKEGVLLGDVVAQKAWQAAASLIQDSDMMLEIALFDRNAWCVARTGLRPVRLFLGR